MDKLLELIEKNPRLTNAEMAVMLGVSEEAVNEKIKEFEQSGVIKGYRAIIDKDKTEAQTVTALIEIKVQPKSNHGFDDIAKRIAQLDEVESVYLMSGGFDLACTVTDKSFQEVAMFVAKRLSPMDDVMSTATHFILKKFKEQGLPFAEKQKDDRGNISF